MVVAAVAVGLGLGLGRRSKRRGFPSVALDKRNELRGGLYSRSCEGPRAEAPGGREPPSASCDRGGGELLLCGGGARCRGAPLLLLSGERRGSHGRGHEQLRGRRRRRECCCFCPVRLGLGIITIVVDCARAGRPRRARGRGLKEEGFEGKSRFLLSDSS